MNDRIKEIRKKENLSQHKFADRLGISRGNIAAYEVGKNAPSDAVISLICREFNVNEEWLRTGNGEMYFPSIEDDRYASNVGKLQRADDETIIRWVNAIAETNPEILKQIEEFMKKVLDIE